MPSTKVYKCVQDNNGFLWFATDAGICRFDGHSFKTYTSENGFTDYGAYHMLLDSKNRLWFFTFTGNTCYYKDGVFYPFNLTHGGNSLSITWIDEASSGDLWFTTNNGFVMHCSGDLEVKWIKEIYPRHKISSVWSINDSLTLVWDVGYRFYIDKDYRIEKISNLDDNIYHTKLLKLKDGRIIYTNQKGINLVENKEICLVLPFKKGFMSEHITCLQEDNEGNLWIGNPEGAFCFKQSIISYSSCKKYFTNIAICSILNDKEGNYWFTTDHNGVYTMPDAEEMFIPATKNFKSGKPLVIKYIKKIGETAVFFDDSLNSYHLECGEFIETDLPKTKAINVNYKKTQGIWCADDKTTYFFSARDTLTFPMMRNELFASVLIEDPSTVIFFFDYIYRKTVTGNTVNLIKDKETIRFSKVSIQDDIGNLWFSSITGLSIFNGKDIADISKTILFKSYITEMETDLSGNIWMASKGNGILCFKNGKLQRQLNRESSIIPNNCNALHADDDSNVWVGTNYGLYKISAQGIITSFSAFNTLPDQEVTDVCIVGDKVYAATPSGIVIFNKNKRPTYFTYPPNTFITGFFINGRDTLLTKNYVLSHTQNNIKISYTGVSFSGGEDVLYQYKLESTDSVWHETNHNVVEFSSLNPGKYILKVRSFIAGQPPGEGKEAVINFEINPAFWQTWWFKVIILLVTVFAAYYIFRWFWKKQNREVQLKREIIENELKALRAQINPHFLFNSLNSIQEFILYNQPEEASSYLTKFAMLMRMIIEYSKQNQITLEEENSFLTLYLQLEQLRFNNSFNFKITNSFHNGTCHLKIPPMVLQSIVENSVKHGLADKKQGGMITIEYSLTETNRLCCKISDNGIGRERSLKLKPERTNYKSVGLKNIEERLNLLGDKSVKGVITITDIYDNGIACGTCVEVIFPNLAGN